MLFSLIIATLNRADELSYCLESIREQTFQDYEVLIVDQSDDTSTKETVAYSGLTNVIYKQVPYKGLSRARNVAIAEMSGDYFCLIDDDAFYDKNYLLNASMHIKKAQERDILSGILWNTVTGKELSNYQEIPVGKPLTVRGIVRHCPSAALIFPYSVIKDVGNFDEYFGVGAQYGAAEETDLILRAKKIGYNTKFYDDLRVEHPHKLLAQRTINDTRKIYNYSYGTGAMFRKHFDMYKDISMLIPFGEYILKSLFKSLLHKKEATEKLKGLVRGFKEYSKTMS